MVKVRWFAVALAALLVHVPGADAADWLRMRTPHFTVEGDVSNAELHEVALRFEQFREVLGQILPGARLVTRTPVTVVVFAYDREFKAVQPLYQGKPIDSDGYAIVTPFGTSIAISLQKREAAYPIIYHEYGHLLISDAVPMAPVWVQEGLAEYYKTFTLSADRKSAVVGRPVSPGELNLLRGRRLLPLPELLAADHDSKMYNVGTDRQRFYAECWLLVHYLQLGSKARAGQFGAYLSSVARGVPPQTALAQTIPDIGKLESELSDYLYRLDAGAMTLRFTSKADRLVTDATYQSAAMTRAEAEASVGRLLAEQQRFAEAAPRLAAALTLDPESGPARVGLGLIDLMQERPLDALPRLREGAGRAGSDALAHFLLGLAALRCKSPECTKQPGLPETARAEFGRAVGLTPEFPDALSYLGFSELATDGDITAAQQHLEAAIGFLPGREDYRVNLAQVFMRQREFARAQALLGPVAAASPTPEFKAAARELLGQLAGMKNAELALERARQSIPTGPSPGAGTPPGDAPSGPPRTTFIYRKTGEHERRVEGILSAIQCARGAIVVAIRDGAATRRFFAPALDQIDFITYRDDLSGSVSCGPQAGAMRVYLTSRAPAPGEPALPAGTEGRVVAIEYLPKDK